MSHLPGALLSSGELSHHQQSEENTSEMMLDRVSKLAAEQRRTGEETIGDLGRKTKVSWWSFCLLMLPFWCLQIVLIGLSDGAYHDDDVSHFIISRRAWSDPVLFLNVWGRPGFTIPYALTAIIGSPMTGWLACRLLSVVICTMTAVLTTRVAAKLNFRNPEWCGPLFMLIPLNFQLSITTLTETICGLYFILATWLFLEKRWYLAAVVLGLTMLTRHEAIVTVAAGSLVLLSLRRVGPAFVVWLPEVLWNAACYRFQSYDIPVKRFLSANANHSYGSGGLAHGFWMWAEAAGTVAIVLTVLGGVLLLKCSMTAESDGKDSAFGTRFNAWTIMRKFWIAFRDQDTEFLSLWLIVGGAWGTVLLNTILYSFNFFASGGYGRFLVPAAPWMALCVHAAVIEAVGQRTADSSSFPSTSNGWAQIIHRGLGWGLSSGGLVAMIWLTIACSITLMMLQIDRWFLSYVTSYIVSPAVTLGSVCLFAGFLSLKNRHAGLSRLSLQMACMVGCMAWGIAFVGASQPLRLTPTQTLFAKAVKWIEERSPNERSYVSANSPFGEVFAAEAGFRDVSIYTLRWLKEPFYLLFDTQCMMEKERSELLKKYKARKIHEIVTSDRTSQTTAESTHAVEIYSAGHEESRLTSNAM